MLDKSRTLSLRPSVAVKMNREGTGYQQHGMSRSSTELMSVVFNCFIWTVNFTILTTGYDLCFSFIMPTFLLCVPLMPFLSYVIYS